MRVLFIAYRDPKNPSAVGGDYYLWELARGLSRLGHTVTYVCSLFEGSEYEEVNDGVEVVRIPGGWGLPFRVLNEYLKRLRGRFDVVVEEAIGGQRVPFFAGVYVRRPLVAVWHQRHDRIFHEQYSFPVAIALSFLERFLARLYKNRTIVTPSKGAKEKLLQLGFKPNSINVVYDGVGEIFYSAVPSRRREDLVVYLGKLRRYKRADHAILALERVAHLTTKPCRLIIAGKASEIDRSYIDWLRDLAEQVGVAELVEIKVNISEKEKLELLEKARVLVQPSPVEGFSIVVAEANRCGTPVVVSDGIPSDVVVNGHNGLVYPFGDLEALATRIAKLVEDYTFWTRLSKNACEWSQQFNWESSVLKFLQTLKYVNSKQVIDDPC